MQVEVLDPIDPVILSPAVRRSIGAARKSTMQNGEKHRAFEWEAMLARSRATACALSRNCSTRPSRDHLLAHLRALATAFDDLETPVAYAPGSRQKLSMISTVTNQGKARWMIIDDVFNADRLIEFLAALIKDAGNKIFLILDNLRVHHSKPVKAWLTDHGDLIEVFYLPSYAPELNPDERLNADLKQAIGAKVAVRTKAKLKSAAEAHMTTIETATERVKSYFQDPNVRYAA